MSLPAVAQAFPARSQPTAPNAFAAGSSSGVHTPRAAIPGGASVVLAANGRRYSGIWEARQQRK